MKSLVVFATTTTLILGTFALPASTSWTGLDSAISRSGQVEALHGTIQGPNAQALPAAPAHLTSSVHAFLQKYQPFSDAASNSVGSKNNDLFPSSGYCFSDFPCFSVSNAAVAKIGSAPEITTSQLSALLDQMVAKPSVTYDQPNHKSVLNGYKLTTEGATVEIIGPPGSIDSKVAAGMVFDMYKLQSADGSTNSIRAVQAKTDGHAQRMLGLCLYPDGVDMKIAQNFCTGKRLDGSPL